jgi:hypothetical protein
MNTLLGGLCWCLQRGRASCQSLACQERLKNVWWYMIFVFPFFLSSILFSLSVCVHAQNVVGPIIRLSRIQAPDGKQFYDLLARVNPAVWPKTHFPLRH